MRLSDRGLNLLSSNNFVQLQALPYQDLLSESARKEVLAAFIKKSSETNEHTSENSIFIRRLNEACVISSGYIFSRSMLDNLFLGRTPVCPMTGEVLIKNIGGRGHHYIPLPKLDQTINAFRSLGKTQKASVIAESRQTETILVEPRLNSVCCCWPRLFTARRQEPSPISTSQIMEENNVTGTVQLKVAQGRLSLKMNLPTQGGDYNTIKELLAFMLPNGEVLSTHLMDSSSFARCWEQKRDSLKLRLWFPLEPSEQQKGVFNDRRLGEILKHMLLILRLTGTEEDNTIPTYTMADLDRNYKILLDEIPASLAQMLNCVATFLRVTATIAQLLGYPVNDTVTNTAGNGIARRTENRVNIGALHNSLTSTSLNFSTTI